jgi:hypothetical protein
MLALYFDRHPENDKLFCLSGYGLEKFGVQCRQLGIVPDTYYSREQAEEFVELLWQTDMQNALAELSQENENKIVNVEEAAIRAMFKALITGDVASFEKLKKRIV